MSGYFENLIDSYAPSPDAVMPAAVEAWQPEERPGRDLPNTPEPETVSGETGASLPPMTEETPIAPLPAPFENTDEDSGDDNIVPLPLSERIVDHVTERIEPIPDPPIPRDADTAPDDPPPRPPDIIHETHEHFHEDHFHHETPLISEAPQAQDPEPASPDAIAARGFRGGCHRRAVVRTVGHLGNRAKPGCRTGAPSWNRGLAVRQRDRRPGF